MIPPGRAARRSRAGGTDGRARRPSGRNGWELRAGECEVGESATDEMIYYALRSSEHYLRVLADVRRTERPYRLVSVGGGLAFLHGIGPAAASIAVVDIDEEVVEYCTMIVGLIQATEQLDGFIELITRHRFERTDAGILLTEPVDTDAGVGAILGSGRLLNCYRRTIGAMVTEAAACRATLGQSTIHFQGSDLTPHNFSWRFGEGNFTDQETYLVMREVLKRTAPSIARGRLELFDFSGFEDSIPVTFLASNCGSPLFARGDLVFRSIAAGCRLPTRYVSWHRDLVLEPQHIRLGWGTMDTPKKRSFSELPDLQLQLLSPRSADRERPGWPARIRQYSSIEELYEGGVYGAPLLVIELDSIAAEAFVDTQGLFGALYEAVAPCFLELLFLTEWDTEAFLARAAEARFDLSYRYVEHGTIDGRGYLLLRLRGLSTKPVGWRAV